MPNSLFMGVPGGNPSGQQNLIPGVGGTPVPSIGTGGPNPLTPAYPTGSANAPLTFPANTGGQDPNALLTALEGMSPSGFTTAQPGAQGGPTQQWYNQLTQAFHKAGYPSAIAGLLAEFLASGAGFNPAAIQSLLAALQPGVARGEANIMEQFGAEGLGASSPAAIGMGDFLSQVSLDEGQIISQMYEQSVQDYMQVLMSGKKGSQTSGLGALLGGAGAGTSMVTSALSSNAAATAVPAVAALA